ncbi:MAG: class I SAM-dependent methyltransferase, partial [Pseudomonadota bacterium]
MTNGAADIEDAFGPPIGPLGLDPAHDSRAAAIVEPAQRANYDVGLFATTGGALGGFNDGGGTAVVGWVKSERPDWRPKRILDIGCTIGHNAVPIAQAFPDAEVIAIDTAAASLRYGAARAASMGVTNI